MEADDFYFRSQNSWSVHVPPSGCALLKPLSFHCVPKCQSVRVSHHLYTVYTFLSLHVRVMREQDVQNEPEKSQIWGINILFF